MLPLARRAPRPQTGIGSRSGPLALKFRQIGAAQDRSGRARTSPTHPSGGITRGARDGRRARHGSNHHEPLKREGKFSEDT